MAPLQDFSLKKVLFLLLLLLVFFASTFISAHQPKNSGRRRSMLEVGEEENAPVNKKKTTSAKLLSSKNTTMVIKSGKGSSSNQTKLNKSTNGSIKNQTKIIKLPSDSAKNKTKPIKSTSDSIKDSTTSIKSQLKKLNSTSKTSNSTTTKTRSISPKKSSDLTKLSSSKNKTTKLITSKESKTKIQLEKSLNESKPRKPEKTQPKKAQEQSQPRWIDQDDDDEDDLVSGFIDLPSKFQETLLPDLERISKTSKVYLTKYNKEFTKGFKPYVGNKYAPMIASIASFAFILIPLVLVSLIFNRIKAYFSIQKVLIFIQAYLTMYFSILCLSALVTGHEPVKFFYATSQSTYVCVQVLQTLAYVLYLLLLLMYLILVFSTETGLTTKILGLVQTFVGFAVGLHCYMTVFHRAVLHQPPKTSWKIHALYATCFLVICLLGRVDRRKKAYVEDDGEEGKNS